MQCQGTSASTAAKEDSSAAPETAASDTTMTLECSRGASASASAKEQSAPPPMPVSIKAASAAAATTKNRSGNSNTTPTSINAASASVAAPNEFVPINADDETAGGGARDDNLLLKCIVEAIFTPGSSSSAKIETRAHEVVEVKNGVVVSDSLSTDDVSLITLYYLLVSLLLCYRVFSQTPNIIYRSRKTSNMGMYHQS